MCQCLRQRRDRQANYLNGFLRRDIPSRLFILAVTSYKITVSRWSENSHVFGCPTMKYFSDYPQWSSEAEGLKVNYELNMFFFKFLSPAAHPGLCLTEPCITVASAVMGALDRSVDPCHDFYNFACGGWVKSNPLPEGKSRWGPFSNLWEHNMLVMKHLLGKC